MLTLSDIEKTDTTGMYEVYDNWANIAKDAISSEIDKVDFTGINHIVFCGMGGSGTIGDTLASILSRTNVHVCVVKGYVLPKTVDKNTLVVVTSVSGNTSETNHVVRSALNSNAKIVGFSSGGKLERFCSDNKIEFRKIKMMNSPRASFASYLYSIIHVLEPILPLQKTDITESIECLTELSDKISTKNLNQQNPALSLAKWIKGIPMIYYPWGLGAAAIRFKNSIQENAKSHAIAEDIIEACHNGIVSWERKSNVQPILVEGRDDNIKTKERWKIIKEYFETYSVDYKEIHSVEGSVLSKLVSLIYLLDFTSIYLAYIRNVDPYPVMSINFLKKRL